MEKNDERLGTAPLGKLMVSMALPAVAAQLINVLYNIVDRIYIGHIAGYGDIALTGLVPSSIYCGKYFIICLVTSISLITLGPSESGVT